MAWPSIFCLALRRLIAEKNPEAARVCLDLSPPRVILFWEVLIRHAVSIGVTPSKVLNRFLSTLAASHVSQLILFALNTNDASFLCAFNAFGRRVFSPDYEIASFRQHSLICALFARFASLPAVNDFQFDQVFGCKMVMQCYRGVELLGPARPAGGQSKPDFSQFYAAFFDLVSSDSAASPDRFLAAFGRVSRAKITFANLIKFTVERDSSDSSDDKLVRFLVKLDSMHPLLSDSVESNRLCIVDGALQILDTIAARFRSTFRSAASSSTSIPIPAQAKLLKARRLRQRLLDSAWLPWEQRIKSDAMFAEYFGPPWKEDGRSQCLCHAHLAEGVRAFVISRPVDLFKTVELKLHRDHIKDIARDLAAHAGVGQISIRDVPLATLSACLEPVSPSGEESPLCSLIFAVLNALDHAGAFSPFVPESVPGLILFCTEAANLIAASPPSDTVVFGESTFHPFFTKKLNTLKSVASCPYGFDALCCGPIRSSLLASGTTSDPNAHSPTTLWLGQRLPRDAKAFVLLWLWLRAGAAPAPLRDRSQMWFKSIAFLMNDRASPSVDPSQVLSLAAEILTELAPVVASNSQRLWSLCAVFDILDTLASLHCFKEVSVSEDVSLACCNGVEALWNVLLSRINEGKADQHDPAQLHLLAAVNLLSLLSESTLAPPLVSELFRIFNDFLASILRLFSSKGNDFSSLQRCAAQVAHLAVRFCQEDFLRETVAIIGYEKLSDVWILLVKIVADPALRGSLVGHSARIFIPIVTSAVPCTQISLGTTQETFVRLLEAMGNAVGFEQEWLQLLETASESAEHFQILVTISGPTNTLSCLLALLSRDDLVDDDPVRMGSWRVLRRLLVSKQATSEVVAPIFQTLKLIESVILPHGLRAHGGIPIGGVALPVSVEIVSICFEILQAVSVKSQQLMEEILLAIPAVLHAVNNCESPGAVPLLENLLTESKSLIRLLFFVKELLKRKKIVQEQSRHHRAIPLLVSNLLSVSPKLMTQEVYKIVILITQDACGFQELVFFLHKFQVAEKLTASLSAPMTFQLQPNISGGVKAIAQKIGDGSRRSISPIKK